MAREPNLTVRLEARIRDFERQMERATRTADRQFTQIETRASAMSGRLAGIGKAAFAGFAAGAVAALAPMAVFNNAMKTLADASNMAKAADRVGLTTKAFQELQFGMSLAGVEAATFQTGMEQFTKRMGDAATKGGTLAKILEANGVAIRDTNGNIRTSESLLRDYANLIKNAGSEQEQLVLATEAFGRSAGAAFVTALRNGESAIDDFAKATEDAGGVIDEELLRRAEELDDRFAAMWRNFEVTSKSSILTAIVALDDLIAKINGVAASLSKLGNSDFFMGAVDWLDRNGLMSGDITLNRGLLDESASRREVSAMRDRVSQLSSHVKSLRAIGEDATVAEGQLAEAQARLNQRVRQITSGTATTGETVLPAVTVTADTPTTIIPAGGTSGGRGGGRKGGRGGGGRDKALAQAMREAEAVLRVIESLQAERAEIGMTDVERAKANALRAAGAAATTEQAAEIMALIDAIYAERDAVEAANAAMEEMRGIGRDVLGDFISDLRQGKSASDALAGALQKVADRLIDISLDSIFSKGSGGGGFFGSLFKAFGFANGGIASGGSPVMGGKPLKKFAKGGISRTAAIFGEAGPEAAVPLPDGRSIPVTLNMPKMRQSTETIRVILQDDSGRMADIADQQIRTSAGAIVEVSVQRSTQAVKQGLPGMIANAQTRQM